MQYTSEALQQLIEEFSRLPGIGRKSARRLALPQVLEPLTGPIPGEEEGREEGEPDEVDLVVAGEGEEDERPAYGGQAQAREEGVLCRSAGD